MIKKMGIFKESRFESVTGLVGLIVFNVHAWDIKQTATRPPDGEWLR